MLPLMVDHSKDLLGRVSGQFNDEKTSDIQVELKNGQVLFCHQIILCMWSPVWATSLSDDKKARSLPLVGHDASIVEMCVKYCYTSSIQLTDENLTKVHLFAHAYEIKALLATCEKVITEGISVTNCLSLYHHLQKHQFESLPTALEDVRDFVCSSFVAVCQVNTPGFLTLPFEDFCKFLEEDTISASEDQVLEACKVWLGECPAMDSPEKSGWEAKRERLLKLVRFPLLSPDALTCFKETNSLYRRDLKKRLKFSIRWSLSQSATNPEPLRMILAKENSKLGESGDRLTPRSPNSRILDGAMTKTLFSMLGGQRAMRPLVDSRSGTTPEVFNNAVKNQGPFVCIIKSNKGYVFGAYVEDTFTADGGWITGSPNNFLFSLKNIPPQQVVKLKRKAGTSYGVCTSGDDGLHMGYPFGFSTFCPKNSTVDSPAFELAPGYESVGSKTLCGEFGYFAPEFAEVFAVSPCHVTESENEAANTANGI